VSDLHVSVDDLLTDGDRQAQERWGGLDMYSMLTQLGVIPAPQPS
jgi:hypothetical protein